MEYDVLINQVITSHEDGSYRTEKDFETYRYFSRRPSTRNGLAEHCSSDLYYPT
jgi:hypothetical protein